jgi:hypothetical protein
LAHLCEEGVGLGLVQLVEHIEHLRAVLLLGLGFGFGFGFGLGFGFGFGLGLALR